MSTSTHSSQSHMLDLIEADLVTRGIRCARLSQSLVVGDFDLRLGLVSGSHDGNSIYEFHVCGARTQFQTFFVNMASGLVDVEQAAAEVFDRWQKGPWQAILSALLDTANVPTEMHSAQGRSYREVSSPCSVFGTHRTICAASFSAHLNRVRELLDQQQPGFFAVDTLISSRDGDLSACEVKVNNRLEDRLTKPLQESYQFAADPGTVFIRHLLLRCEVSAPRETSRIRILRVLWHWFRGEQTSERLTRGLRDFGFPEIDATAYAMLLPECFAFARWRRYGLAEVVFWVLDRKQVSHHLKPETTPQLRLALDLAEEIRCSRALLDPTQFSTLVSMSSIDDSLSKAYAENSDLTGGVLATVLNAPMAEDFGLA